MSVSDFMQSKA